MLTRMRTRDHEENIVTARPEDEYVDLCCMWAVEFYTPAQMDSLVKYAVKLDKAARFSPSHARTVTSWLDNTMGHPFSSSWMNLGTWQPKGKCSAGLPTRP